MKIKEQRTLTWTRKELEAIMIAAAGLPADVKLDYFSVESACLVAPQPVVHMSVTLGETES